MKTTSLVAFFMSTLITSRMWSADAAPAVPVEVLAQAAQIEAAAKRSASAPPLAPPTPETLKIADEVDVLLLTSRVLLDQQEPTKGGDRFVSAVKALQGLSRAQRKALGARYIEQRKQLMELAQRLLADPAVAVALETQPLPEVSPASPAEAGPVEQVAPR